nr:MAG TPA: hypothetical protein [Caudoviricetes sp.]
MKTESVFWYNRKNRISMDTCDYLEVDSDG